MCFRLLTLFDIEFLTTTPNTSRNTYRGLYNSSTACSDLRVHSRAKRKHWSFRIIKVLAAAQFFFVTRTQQ